MNLENWKLLLNQGEELQLVLSRESSEQAGNERVVWRIDGAASLPFIYGTVDIIGLGVEHRNWPGKEVGTGPVCIESPSGFSAANNQH